MGQICCGPESDDDIKKKHDSKLTRFLNEQNNNEKSVVKMLLLGTGESGKSTIFKQLKILNEKESFTKDDRNEFKKIIYYNIMCAIRDVCVACRDLGIHYGSDENRHRAQKILPLDPKVTDPRELRLDIKTLWNDSGIKTAMTRTNEFYIIDSAEYFVGQNLDRICSDDFVPNDQDILRCRKATKATVDYVFTHDNTTTFKVYDVGGQRGKRKKWIQCFDNVTAIIFVASLSEYDQELMEQKGKNRMQESLQLFEGICSLPWFKKTPVILFLNKQDILLEKIKRSDLSRYFPAFKGGDDYEKAAIFIRSLYEKRKPLAPDHFYPHFTCATDTNNMKFVMKATVEIIMKKCLEDYGLTAV